MRARIRCVRHASRPLSAAILAGLALVAAVGAVIPGLATGRAPTPVPRTPTCTRFSTAKLGAVLNIGRFYLDHSLGTGPDSDCTYYGVTAAQATALLGRQVPYNQIKYYPSLMITIETTTATLVSVELGLLRRAHPVEPVARVLSPFSKEWFSSGEKTGANLPACPASGILYNNWVGGPECKQQPALKQVSVLGYIRLAGGTGRMVLLNAAQQSPPGSLSISHMLALAEASVEGRLY